MKILIFSLSGIGDALMFTPALKLLRQTYPDALIDALCMFKGVKDIYDNNSSLDNVYYFNMLKEGPLRSFIYMLKFVRKYDVSINVYPSNRKEYNLLAFFAGAKKRAAVSYIREDKKNFGFLNNVSVQENDSLHNVEENVRLVEKITGLEFKDIPPMEISLTPEDEKFACEYLNKTGIKNGELVIGFHPGCATLKNHINRRWEPSKFAELGKKLIERTGAKILTFGGPEERELKREVSERISSANAYVVEANSLSQSAAIMKRCDIFVTNDSSLMHLSSALKLNVVAIIGPTNANYIAPWATEHKIVSLGLDCSPCFFYSPRPLECKRTDTLYKCIREITPDMVFDACTEFISSK